MIVGFAQNEQGEQALDYFEQMQHEGILANEVTYMCTFKACKAIGAIDNGKEVCDEIVRRRTLEHYIMLRWCSHAHVYLKKSMPSRRRRVG